MFCKILWANKNDIPQPKLVWLSWLERHSIDWKVVGSIPWSGHISKVVGSIPTQGVHEKATHQYFSLSLFLFSSF